jgi:putative oxidoreductase
LRPIKDSIIRDTRAIEQSAQELRFTGSTPVTTQVDSANQVSNLPAAAPEHISRRFFAWLASGGPVTGDLALLILRVAFGAALALTHGRAKLTAPERFVEALSKRNFPLPGFFGWAAILTEFVGGALLVVGLLTRPAATLVVITLGVAAFDFHSADPFAKRELALAYAVVALSVAIAGPGRYSLDRWLGSPSRPQR